MSGFAGTAKTVNSDKNLWGWSEIHWSTNDPSDFELNKYTCPKIEPYNLDGEVPGVVGLPEELHEKSLQQIHSKLTKGNIDIDTYAELKRQATEQLAKRTPANPAHKAIVCKKVTQWIIVEVQPVIGVEWGVLSSFPAVDLWAFLQPFEIGDTKRMAKYDDWVVDDYPRAGWFHTKIRWFPNYDAQGKVLPKFTPMMSMHGRNTNSKNILEWREIPCVLTKEESKSRTRHPVRPSYGEGYRFLFKLPVEIENYQTPQDLERKNKATELLKTNGKLTSSQRDRLMRFEVGSYLKVWARNAFWNWSAKAAPSDDDTENCMKQMEDDDNPKLHALQKLNAFFNKPTASGVLPIPTRGTVGDPTNPNYYIKYYDDFSLDNMLARLSSTNTFAPDQLAQQSLNIFKNKLIFQPTQSKDPLEGLTSREKTDVTITEGTISQKEKERFIPPIFKEGYDSETTYSCGGDTFRPFSFRNHVWKRNRFSEDGAYHEDMWIHVLLWPTEAMYDLSNIDSVLLKEPSRAPVPVFFGISLVYIALLNILGATIAKNSTKVKLAKKLTSLFEWEELPTLAATFACYGLPDPKITNWHGNLPKSIVNMLNKIKERLGEDEVSSPGAKELTFEYIVTNIFKFLQSMIGCYTYKIKSAGSATQQMFLDALIGVKFKQKKGFCKGDWFKPEPTVSASAMDCKASLELGIMSKEQKLAAWPVPVPFLQWMAFAITLKTALKGTGEIDFSAMFGEVKDRKIGFELAPDGHIGIFFDLGAIWTLASTMDSAFTGPKKKDEKGEDLEDHPVNDTLKKIFEMVDLQLGSAAKIVVTGKAAWALVPDKMGQKGACDLDGAPYLKIALEIPLYWKISMASGMIAKVKFTLLTWTSSAVVLFPSGIIVEALGGFAGALPKFGPIKPQRWKLKEAFMDKYVTIDTQTPLAAGKKFGFTFSTSEILASEERIANKTVDHFEAFFITPDAARHKLAKLAGEYKFVRTDKFNQIIAATTYFELSHERLDYGDSSAEKYKEFVSQLLIKDQRVDIDCIWNSDELQRIRLWPDKPHYTVKSPRIFSFNFCNMKDAIIATSQSLTFLDRIKIKFTVINMSGRIPLYIHLFEIDRGQKKAPYRILRKDKRKGYFEAVAVGDTEYGCTIPLWELGQIVKKDGDNDSCWELCCTISLDSNGIYPVRFTSQGATGDLGYGTENKYSESYVKIMKAIEVKV